MSLELSGVVRGGGREESQDASNGRHPNAEGSMYIIPQRLTVAGWTERERERGGVLHWKIYYLAVQMIVAVL